MLRALDNTLAAIGGYAGLVWMIVNLVVGNYASFKLSSSMVKTLYQYQEKPNNASAASEEELLDEQFLIKDL